jgi:hypothetical protein
MAKPLPIGKTLYFIAKLLTWQNPYLLMKPFYFLLKPLPFDENFLFLGKTSIFWRNLFISW